MIIAHSTLSLCTAISHLFQPTTFANLVKHSLSSAIDTVYFLFFHYFMCLYAAFVSELFRTVDNRENKWRGSDLRPATMRKNKSYPVESKLHLCQYTLNPFGVGLFFSNSDIRTSELLVPFFRSSLASRLIGCTLLIVSLFLGYASEPSPSWMQ